ncbi:sulfite exporter TauE/SafE family protein [Planktotalea sp.]|uniref:sulfite exporter TauE/SafE family protein n=1 Tax=Planktotalea sp. TaxID=2029877 RepID=UPI003D6C4F22
MDQLLTILSPSLILAALVIACVAGVIKGIVGFSMPTIILSGISTFTTPEIALAGLLLPTLFTNAMQSFRFGRAELWAVILRFRIFLLSGAFTIFAAAQLVPIIPTQTLLIVIGGAVTCFAFWQLSSFAPAPGQWSQKPLLEGGIGAFAGIVGGISGMWGPPTVAYLTAIGTEKRQQILAQGVIYGLGAVLLVIAHIKSGILNSATLPLSLALLPSAMIGMWIGGRLSDRFDQAMFRRATLLVLIVSGLNLLRRGLVG